MHDGKITAIFATDGTFRMENRGTGHAVKGTYALSDGILTLSEAEGDLGKAQFPMRCAITPQDAGFALAEDDGTCTFLAGASFTRGNM